MKPPVQPDLFDGPALRDQGMALAEANAPEDWRQSFRSAIEDIANGGNPFTCEDALDHCGPPPEGLHPNATGAIFAGMVRRLKCEYRGTTFSRKPSSHAARIGVWQLWHF